jgi:hypothetical protein
MDIDGITAMEPVKTYISGSEEPENTAVSRGQREI